MRGYASSLGLGSAVVLRYLSKVRDQYHRVAQTDGAEQ